MASIGTRTIAFLLNQGAVTALAKRAIYETRPQSGDTYVVVRTTGIENADVLNGSVGDEPLFYSVAIDCVSSIEATANDLRNAIRTALHLYRGAFADGTAKGCFVDAESLDEERYGDGSNHGPFTRTLDVRIAL